MTDILVKKEKDSIKDPTLLSLKIESISQEEILPFDRQRIVDSLVNELNFSLPESEKVTVEVEKRIREALTNSKSKYLYSSSIRITVNNTLRDLGYSVQLQSKNEFTMSHYAFETIVERSNNENGNTEHNPESINLTIAEAVIKDYMLKKVFSSDIAKAHLEGKIHVHDIGMVRAYCSGNSPLYVLRNGLKNVPNIMSTSRSANSAQTFARHLCSMTQFLTSQFAGAIGWEAVNVFFSPLCRNLNKKELKQLAQTLIYDLSQLAGAKGGQTSFTDFNMYITVPQHYRNTYAMFEGGKFGCIEISRDHGNMIKFFDTREEVKSFADENKNYKILTYTDYEKDAQRFLSAIIEVSKEGDAAGLPFAFPKINLHVNEDVFTVDGKENKEGIKLLEEASEAAAKNGSIYFIYDRNAMSVAQCCRLSIQFSEEDKKLVETPEELRFVGVQNVSINLPNCALQSKGNEEKFFKELELRMRLAMKAHVQKTKYLEHIMSLQNSPLKFYNKGMDGKPYVNLKKGSYLIGIVGLNECVYNLIGKQLHEDQEAHKKGIQIILFMNKITKQLSKEFDLTVKLEETPAESTAARFAILDKRKYPDAFVKQNDKGTYYTNSIHFAYDSDIDYIDRLIKQSAYHTLIDAGAMLHLWVGDHLPSSKAIFNLVKKTWYETKCAQWVVSPELTVCHDCNKTYVGFFDKCPKCESENVDMISRVTGYFVKVSKLNKGKKAELQDRNHDAYKIGE